MDEYDAEAYPERHSRTNRSDEGRSVSRAEVVKVVDRGGDDEPGGMSEQARASTEHGDAGANSSLTTVGAQGVAKPCQMRIAAEGNG